MAVKSFVILGPVANVIKLFKAVITSLSAYLIQIIEKYAASGVIMAEKKL